MEKSLLEHALEYAQQGWKVFPCKPDKSPYVKGGFKSGTTDIEQITEWWTKWPEASIAWAVPADMVVVDIDCHDGQTNGFETIRSLGLDFPGTQTSISGGGGSHLIYKCDRAVKIKKKQFPGIDIIHGGKGYIILPPSRHESGRKYKWEPGNGFGELDIADAPAWFYYDGNLRIPQGGRNDELFLHAVKMHHAGNPKDTVAEALAELNENACEPPLDDDEVNSIVDSATGYPRKPIFEELEMINRFCKEYCDNLVFSSSRGWLFWNSEVWEPSESQPYLCAEEFLTKFKIETMEYIATLDKKEARTMRNTLESQMTKRKIDNLVGHAKHKFSINPNILDSRPFELNTPSGIVDLKTGKIGPHDPKKFHTKMTSIGPSNDGMGEWLEFLNLIFENDQERIDFLQIQCGRILVGGVFSHGVLILYGRGGTGKSTLVQAISSVLGNYSTNMNPLLLSANCKLNTGSQLTRLRGSRLAVFSELEEDSIWDGGMLKTISSVDTIVSEEKYQKPETFSPSHFSIFHSNHLPRLNSRDSGLWDRIIILPMNFRIRGTEIDVKAFNNMLLKNSGQGILQWMILGAKKFIKNEFQFSIPATCRKTMVLYKNDEDWLKTYLREKCELSPDSVVRAGDVYEHYRIFCLQSGSKIRRNNEFYRALSSVEGISRVMRRGKRFIKGLTFN